MAWTFKQRLVSGFILSGLAVCVVGTAAMLSLSRLDAELDEASSSRAENLARAERLRAQTELLAASGRAYLFTGHERYLQRARIARENVRASLALLATSAPAEHGDALAPVESAERAYDEAFDRATALRRADVKPEALVDFFEDQMRPRRDALEAALDAFNVRERSAFADRALASRRAALGATAFTVAVAALALAIDVAIGLVVSRRLGRLHETTEHAKQARDRALSIVANELRTPLGALAIQLELLRLEGVHGSAADRLGTLRARLGRIVRLLDSILDAARIESGRLPIELEAVDLTRVVREVVHTLDHEIQASGSRLELDLPERAVGWWDALRLEQVVTNLLSNALKYGAGNPVAVRVEAREAAVSLVVRDHGVGIAPDDVGRIFTAFERGRREKDFKGIGLGLWITKQIVNTLGGSIVISSTEGGGATFTVVLPLRSADQVVPRAA